MLCVFWNFEGVIHFELVPDGHSINADLFSPQLKKMYNKLRRKYPGLVNRQQALLQMDNARPHTAIRTRQTLQELDGIELLPHTAQTLLPQIIICFGRWLISYVDGASKTTMMSKRGDQTFLTPNLKGGIIEEFFNLLTDGYIPLNMMACTSMYRAYTVNF